MIKDGRNSFSHFRITLTGVWRLDKKAKNLQNDIKSDRYSNASMQVYYRSTIFCSLPEESYRSVFERHAGLTRSD
jgi:hypothetical protein